MPRRFNEERDRKACLGLRLRTSATLIWTIWALLFASVACSTKDDSAVAVEVVEPAAWERLDPAVGRLLTRLINEAKAASSSAEHHGRLGLAYEANDLWPEARESFAIAMRLDRDERLWRYHFDVATAEVGDFQAALEQYRKLARQDPEFAPVQQRLGMALIESGEFESALSAFESVIDSVPERAEGYLGAAEAQLRLKEPELALELLEQAGRSGPFGARGQYLRGLALRELGREAEAREALAEGAGSQPNSAIPDRFSDEILGYAVNLPARIARADALRQRGEFSESATILESCLIDHPENITVLNNLGSAFLSMREPDRALRYLTKAAAIDGGNFETQILLAFWSLETERIEEASRYAERAVELAPDLAEPYTVRARVLVSQRRYEEAVTDMEKALELEVRNPHI